MKVLLSIKPIFVDKIFSGDKRFEYRKAIFKNASVKTIVVYASSPVKRVVGEFEVERILENDVDKLWSETASDSGISKDFYDDYFKNRSRAFAIKIGRITKYEKPKSLLDLSVKTPPQSFAYLSTGC